MNRAVRPATPPAPPARAVLAGLLVVLLAALAGIGWAAPAAYAAARVSVANDSGRAEASTTSSTTLRVTGSGFQSVQGGFGGIYVFFGWVADPGGSWAPSQGGTVGADYRYVPDSESADNHGYQRFVAFPGSDTESSANGGVVAADGTWSTSIVVPGPTFDAQDRGGAVTTVDCREVQCGVITVGAHGVRNATNESFTPVSFVDAGSGAVEQAPDAGDPPDETPAAASSGAREPAGTDEADRPETATVGIDRATAVAGHALSFAGQGFEPGEQVVALVDDGVLAVGPLNAGTHGEVAGIIELPDDLRVGTHVLRLTGASSGSAPEVELTVRRDPAAVSASEAAPAAAPGADDGYSPAEIAVLVAGLVLLLVVVSSFVTARRRRRDARSDGTPTQSPPAPDGAATQSLPPVAPDVPRHLVGAHEDGVLR
ncbi:hypothetical protein [Cellulosimicrobium arenosum]|uniref:Uncharacterized protein n=1 Tax=Cellulosimicrobium arenosum TaxID=2708133 RepID=A0A927J1C2_9MICO|nr:hypothetical protein [Cellulosimicrobium arenosum]MBD8080078.1 hypothetical protein [Cellulosimicrobium arenosum]